MLGGALWRRLWVALGGHVTTLFNGFGDDATHQRIRPDGIVIAGDGELNDVGIDVGVHDGNHGDLQLVGFGNGDVLFLRVEDEHRVGTLRQVADTAEVLLQLLKLAAEQQGFLLWHRVEFARDLHPLVFLHFGNALGNRFEVGEHATEPALVDVGHATLFGVAAHRILRLLLGADEQDGATLGREFPNEVVSNLSTLERLLEVDDVDAVAFAEDETLHLGVPAAGLMPEVDSGFQHLARGHDCHDDSPLLRLAGILHGAEATAVWARCS